LQGIDEAEIPASAHFTPKTSSAAPTVVFTPETGEYSLLWPDPTGGWTFTSEEYAEDFSVYGYRLSAVADGIFLGCQRLSEPFIVTGDDQVVTLGEVRLPVADNFFDGDE